MFGRFFSRPRPRRRLQAGSLSASIEVLEDRTLLSASTTGAVLDLGDLTVDETSYSSTEILVKFQSAQQGADFTALVNEILPGAASEAISPYMPELQIVTLPEGVSIESALLAFNSSSLIEYAQLNHNVSVMQAPDDPEFDQMWDLENTGQTLGTVDADIDATAAWDVHTGSGSTIVAVTDTGIDYTHPDLIANMWVNTGEIAGDGIDNDGNGYVDDVYGYDFFGEDGDPMDDHGHGTHVAGTIGAVGDNGIGITGINWDVQLMALKFLGADGSGSQSDAIEAILYAVNNGAHVINASWGGDPFSQVLFDAIATARDNDVIFVAAAGNGDIFGNGIDNDATAFYPANYDLENVVSVAATDHYDNLAAFSNYGATTVDLAAPGVNIYSTLPGGGYGYNTGTSMAAPHVAGVIALVRDLNPGWTYDQVIEQVLSSVDPLPQLVGFVSTGGRLNAAAAVGNPEPTDPPPPPVALPVFEDFNDGLAQPFTAQSGAWTVSAGRLDVDPGIDNDDLARIATLRLETLPQDLEIQTTLNVNEGHVEIFGIVVSDYLTNGFVVFDYVSPDEFKFAGADMNNNQWVIGHRDAAGWHIDAAVTEAVDADVDYQLKVVITGGDTVTLFVGGVEKATFTWSEDLTDGAVGVGARNALAHFDNVLVQPPLPVLPGSLPISEDFQDGVPDHLQSLSGLGAVIAGRYLMAATSPSDAISTFLLSDPLPADLEFLATINADDSSANHLSNAFIIFDYVSPTDFKFAGAYVGANQWVIGHRDASGWVTDAVTSSTISALSDYELCLTIRNDSQTTLSVDGAAVVSFTFATSVTGGALGLGTRSAVSRFDDVLVQAFTPPTTTPVNLPLSEDFSDGFADGFVNQVGSALVDAGRYQVTAVDDGDGVSTILFADPLPSDLEIAALLNADAGSSTRLSNGFIIFDYVSPTDFKFAGAYVGANQWVIGHRDASGWVTDAVTSSSINALADYSLSLIIQNDSQVTLSVNGSAMVSFTFASSLTDGALGFGTRDAVSRFDDVVVQEFTPPDPTGGSLPLFEDFNDGLADGFVMQVGTSLVNAGRYQVTAADGGDGVSTIDFADPLPADLEIAALLNADPGSASRLSNGFIIFDYVSPTDFKFAGAYVGANQWVIGHRDASGWVTDAVTSSTINALTDYNLSVTIQNDSQATLSVNGTEMVSFTFAAPLTDGAVGFGTRNAISRFDNVVVQELIAPEPTPVNLPLFEDFSDGVADGFVRQVGSAVITSGRYQVTAATDGDGVSTIDFADPLPADLEIATLLNADPGSTTRLSNGFIIFDYVSPTDFKFAGAYVGVDQWVIGHRDASGWITDAVTTASIDANSDYFLSLKIHNDSQVTLFVDGASMVSFTFASSLTDGAVGLGTRDAISRFDNVTVSPLSSATDTSIGDTDGDVDDKWGHGNHEWTTPPGHDVRDMVHSIIDDWHGGGDLLDDSDDASLGRRIAQGERSRRGR